MDVVILYFIKVNIAFIAIYLFYMIFLNRDTFFREKRFAFIFGFAFAILYPFIDISSWIQGSEQTEAIARRLSNTLPEITVVADQGYNQYLTLENILIATYLLIAAALFIRIFFQIGQVLVLALRCQKDRIDDQSIIRLPHGYAPFSFFGWVFINPDDQSSDDLCEILHHEKVHARQMHTFDVIFSELTCMIFWINPCTWFLKRHLRENLEYIADMDVIHSGFNQKGYQYHLLRLSYQHSTAKVGNYFNVSQLKNRIIMMNKKRTSMAGLCKYALSLPLFALLFLSAYAWGEKQEIVSTGNSTAVAAAPSEKTAAETEAKSDTKNKKANAKETKSITVYDVDNTKNNSEEIYNIEEVNVIGYANDNAINTNSGGKAANTAEKMPEYPGGINGLMAFIASNLRYPKTAIENNIEGRVVVRFIVNETGDVTNIEVIKSLDPSCDNEAIRIVKMMPKWIPAVDKGKNIAVYFTLPIKYKLQGNKSKSHLRGVENGKEPLVIVDGVVRPYACINDSINPERIDYINVFKDSTAIGKYGQKGKNGVIVIKTKAAK